VNARPAGETMDRQATDEMDAEDSDYTRINDYFGCLGFRPDGATTAESTISGETTITG